MEERMSETARADQATKPALQPAPLNSMTIGLGVCGRLLGVRR
jgi:hypothetical protein